VFDAGAIDLRQSNHLRFRLGPDVVTALGVRSKQPGEEMTGKTSELLAVRDTAVEMLPYERLLGDAMDGDPTLFATEEAVEASWRVVDPILDKRTPIVEYEPSTWGPAAANDLVALDGGWHDPLSSAK
jgi:glucose-6-phosphate 1-dehydrogenase